MCSFYTPRCSSSFPPPFCIIEPWRNEAVASLGVITGRGTPGVQVRVKIDGLDPELTALVDASGWWSVSVDEALSPGEHTIYAVQYYGKDCEIFNLPFVVDVCPLPAPTILTPEDGSSVPTGSLTVRGNAAPGNSVTICLDGERCRTRQVDPDGIFRTRFRNPGVTAGSHVVTAIEHDAVTGQSSLTASSQFIAVYLPGSEDADDEGDEE